MKDKKTILLLCVSFMLFITSLVLLWTWMHYKPRNSVVQTNATNSKTLTQDIATLRNDSILKLLSSLEKEVYSRDTIAVNTGLQNNSGLSNAMQTFYTLRAEIYQELNSTMSESEFARAKARISFLQDQIRQLNKSQQDIEAENKRLAALVRALKNNESFVSNEFKTPSVTNSAAEKSTALLKENLTAWDLNLITLKDNDNNSDNSDRAMQDEGQIMASFNSKNGSNTEEIVEFYIVIVQPDGSVLQKSTWESGTFSTTNGRKIYSGKIKAGFSGGEIKRTTFKIATEKFQKGNYSLQLYRNGQIIAKTNKNLS